MFPHHQMRRRRRIWKRSPATVLKRYFPNVPSAGYLDIQNQTLIELNFKSDADVAFESLPPAAKIDTSKVTTSLLFKIPDVRNFGNFAYVCELNTFVHFWKRTTPSVLSAKNCRHRQFLKILPKRYPNARIFQKLKHRNFCGLPPNLSRRRERLIHQK